MTRLVAIILLVINGIGAVFGGVALIIDPTGNSIKLPIDLLKNSPFSDFFIPGLILFVVLGLGSLISCIVVITKAKGYPFLTIFMGFALAIWISIQILMLREVDAAHYIFGAMGILLIILGILLRKEEYGLRL